MIGVSTMSGCPVRCKFCATGNLHRFSETETHYILSNRYCYKRLNNARLSILREVIADFVVDYKAPEKMNGQPHEIEIISIPKDFKRQ